MKMGDKAKELLDRLNKDGKRTGLIVVIGLIAMALIFVSDCDGSNAAPKQDADSSVSVSVYEYADALENKLCSLISKIDGAGETLVMVTLQNGVEYIYASEEKTSSDSSETSGSNGQTSTGIRQDTQSSLIIVDGDAGEQALIRTELMPKVSGVVVVCEGAGDPLVEAKITQAVTTALGISSKRVCISPLSKQKQEAE